MIFGYEGLSLAVGGELSAGALRTRAARGKLPLHAKWCQGSLAFDMDEVQKWAESEILPVRNHKNENRLFPKHTDAPQG